MRIIHNMFHIIHSQFTQNGLAVNFSSLYNVVLSILHELKIQNTNKKNIFIIA
jgi:hypothetical protein